MRRRGLLAGTGASVSVFLGGCFSDVNGGSVTSVETFDVNADLRFRERPWWHTYEEHATGAVFLAADGDFPDYAPRVRVPDEREEAYEAFIEETDFSSARLLQIQSVGPTSCYDSLTVGGFRIRDGTIVGTAEAQQGKDGRDCDHERTYPATLVRIEADETPPDTARITITDGWGNTETEEANRRRWLDPDDIDGYVQPAGEPPAMPEPLQCEEPDLDRWHGPPGEAVALGEAPTDEQSVFTFRTEQRTYDYGDTLQLRLRNLSDVEKLVPSRGQFSFQLRTEAGWQEVRVGPEDTMIGIPDHGLLLRPGQVLDWRIELTEDGIREVGPGMGSELTVCPDLREGRYRFAFEYYDWIGVEFDLLRPEGE